MPSFRLVYRLPLPPSGNRSVRHTKTGGHYVPAPIKTFRTEVGLSIYMQGRKPTIEGDCGLILMLPKVRGDSDNRTKTARDALTIARVWNDDKQVRAEVAVFDESMPKDRCVVVICDLKTHWQEVAKVAARQGESG